MIKKLCKKTIGLILAAAMMLSAAGCGTTDKAASNTQAASNTSAAQESLVKYADKENEEFEKFIQDKFVEDMSSDTPTYNQNFKDGSAFSVERPEAKWAVLPEGKDIPEKIENEKKKLDDEYDYLSPKEKEALVENIWYFRNIYGHYFCFCKGKNCTSNISYDDCKYYFYLSMINDNKNLYKKTYYLLHDFLYGNRAPGDSYFVFKQMVKQNMSGQQN